VDPDDGDVSVAIFVDGEPYWLTLEDAGTLASAIQRAATVCGCGDPECLDYEEEGTP
jgi:hypothetical protein